MHKRSRQISKKVYCVIIYINTDVILPCCPALVGMLQKVQILMRGNADTNKREAGKSSITSVKGSSFFSSFRSKNVV